MVTAGTGTDHYNILSDKTGTGETRHHPGPEGRDGNENPVDVDIFVVDCAYVVEALRKQKSLITNAHIAEVLTPGEVYRIIVSFAIDDLEFRLPKVTNHIDLAFLRADSHVAFRAKLARAKGIRSF